MQQVLQLLLAKGAAVNAADEQGWTPLMLAVRGGKVQVSQSAVLNSNLPVVGAGLVLPAWLSAGRTWKGLQLPASARWGVSGSNPSLLRCATIPARSSGSFYPCVLQGNGSRIDPGFEQQLYLHAPQV